MPARLKSEFAPEWGVTMLLALGDAVWAAKLHFHLAIGWSDAEAPAATLAAMLCLWLFAPNPTFRTRGWLAGEYFALSLAATAVFGVLSYLCLASSGRLVDGALLASDRALGFDWRAGYHFLLTHPLPQMLLNYAYNSLVYQGLYFGLLLAVMGRRRDLREMFWLVFVAGLFTSAGAWLFPALGPFHTIGGGQPDSFLPVMEHLKSGRDLDFALGHLTGVVSFPSFHTTMALAYVWGFRRTGVIGWCILALNLVMLCAIPWFGGHYLTDMIAGAGVMLASLGIVKAYGKWRFSANALPGCAVAYGDACSSATPSR